MQTIKVLACISEAVKNQLWYLQTAQIAAVQHSELHQTQTGHEICQKYFIQKPSRTVKHHNESWESIHLKNINQFLFQMIWFDVTRNCE